jgi:hypothetical protein
MFSSGGVVLASRDGKIVCENTLDARLDVVFRQKLPEVILVCITIVMFRDLYLFIILYTFCLTICIVDFHIIFN